MIHCKPKGFFSRTYILEGEGHKGSISFQWLHEQGSILADGSSYHVEKPSFLRGNWILKQEDREHATAKKLRFFGRSFLIQSPMGELQLVPRSAFSWRFDLKRKKETIATLAREHFFTRRTRIDLRSHRQNQDPDFPTIAFAFWLVLLTRNRGEENSHD